MVRTVVAKEKMPWYAGGLHFECRQCGKCCSGPEEGYIWVSRHEAECIADFLGITTGQLRKQYLRRVGFRTTILEQPGTRDCTFLRAVGANKRCMIYSVRPTQCRNWPFWPSNLRSPHAWNEAAKKCSGINRGRLYTCEEIEQTIKGKGLPVPECAGN